MLSTYKNLFTYAITYKSKLFNLYWEIRNGNDGTRLLIFSNINVKSITSKPRLSTYRLVVSSLSHSSEKSSYVHYANLHVTLRFNLTRLMRTRPASDETSADDEGVQTAGVAIPLTRSDPLGLLSNSAHFFSFMKYLRSERYDSLILRLDYAPYRKVRATRRTIVVRYSTDMVTNLS